MRTLTKKLTTLFACLILSICLLISLFKYSQAANHINNEFRRLFPPHFLTNAKLLQLSYNSFYIAGCSQSNIYLGNATDLALILKTNFTLIDSVNVYLTLPPEVKAVTSAIRVSIDSPFIFLTEGISPKVLCGNLSNGILKQIQYQGISFNAVKFLSSSSYVLRTYDHIISRNILIKCNFSNSKIEKFTNILTKMGDGVFSLDGMIVRDRFTQNLVYLYYYRNQFINLDTNLNILLIGKTIDSITTPQIKLSRIISAETTTFSSPPLIVNKTSCADSGLLFVNSKLKAKNEDDISFETNSVIDIYTLKNGEYKYSFYIPDYLGHKMKSFQVINHQLVALYDHSLMTFSLQY